LFFGLAEEGHVGWLVDLFAAIDVVGDLEVAAGEDGFVVAEDAFGLNEELIAEGEGVAAIGIEFLVGAIDLGGLIGDGDIGGGGVEGAGAKGAPEVLGGEFGENLLVIGFWGVFVIDGLADELVGGLIFVAEEDGRVVLEGVFGIEMAADADASGRGGDGSWFGRGGGFRFSFHGADLLRAHYRGVSRESGGGFW